MSGQVDDQELYDNHVLSVCAALGGLEPLGTGSSELVYVPGDEALACLRDLKRFLRRAEQQRDRRVHHLLRKWHIVQKDLLPMLVASIRNDQLKIASTICELLVPLTWPFDAEGQLAYHDELKEYQEAFLQQDVFASILAVMVHLFSIPHGLRHERDHARLRLLLCLFRNLLAFFDTQVSVTASAEVQWRSILQEQLVTRLYSDGVVDLLMSLCGSLGESEFDGWNTLLVEIFYYMFQRRDISVLLSSDRQGSQLEQLLKKEKASVSTAGRPRTTRHARFGGTFSVALPNGTMVNTRKVAAVASSSADVLPMAAPRLKRTQKDMPSKIPIETPQAQKAFSAIAIQFVKECFNDLAVSMKRDIDRERIYIKPQDTVRFIWLCQFGLELRRDACRTGTMIGLDSILGVLNTPNIVFTLRRLSASRDEKSPVETTFCLKFLNQLLLAIEEMMHQTGDAGMFDVATQLISTLFYEHDNALLLRSLCKESRAHSKSYLETLVACIDTLLGVTERVLAEQGMLVTRKKSRARTSKAPTSAADDGNGTGIGVDGDNTLLASAPAVQQPTGDDASDAEDNEQPRYVEQAFDFRSYMAGFATDGTVATYCQLLRFYPDLENETVEQIVRMLRRLFQDHGCQESFYKLSVMELFGQIANARGAGQASTSGLHKELLSFVALVVGTFVEQVSSNAESGPLALLKIVFGGIRSDKELSLANSD
ncbi:timeless protein-domain-containing protein, partial [Entophlyctis helioformis]